MDAKNALAPTSALPPERKQALSQMQCILGSIRMKSCLSLSDRKNFLKPIKHPMHAGIDVIQISL